MRKVFLAACAAAAVSFALAPTLAQADAQGDGGVNADGVAFGGNTGDQNQSQASGGHAPFDEPGDCQDRHQTAASGDGETCGDGGGVE